MENQRKAVLGVNYYQKFNLLYQSSPFQWTWKCIGFYDNEPMFKRIEPPHSNIHTGYDFFYKNLYTEEEIVKEWNDEKIELIEQLKDIDGFVQFALKKLEWLVINDEYGNAMTTQERELVTKRAKELFNIDINLEDQ